MNIEIRKIDDFSAKLAAELEKETFSSPWDEKSILAEAERGYFIAAFDKDVFLGYAGALSVLDECGICNVAVKADFRDRGVGKALVNDIIDFAKETKKSVVMLEVRRSNAPAVALYEKLGFVKVGERKNFYDFPREDALLYNLYIT